MGRRRLQTGERLERPDVGRPACEHTHGKGVDLHVADTLQQRIQPLGEGQPLGGCATQRRVRRVEQRLDVRAIVGVPDCADHPYQ